MAPEVEGRNVRKYTIFSTVYCCYFFEHFNYRYRTFIV